MKRRLFKLGVFLLLGAAVNVAVAWGLIWTNREEFVQTVAVEGLLSIGDDMLIQPAWDELLSTPGLEFRIHRPAGTTGDYQIDAQAGLPCFSMTGSGLENLVVWCGPPSAERTLKMILEVRHPMARGFAINTIFYAAVLWGGWLLFAAPFAVRRRLRLRRGQCPHCAYPIGTSNLCTECGKPVTAPKHKAQIEKAQIT